MLREVKIRLMLLRQTHGGNARTLLCRVDVKNAFRQVLVYPAGAPAFDYMFGDRVVVDLRLQFGWRNSPGFWGLMACALEHANTHSTFQGTDYPKKGLLPSRTSEFPRRGGFQLSLSPVIVGLFLALVAMLGTTSL